WYMRRRRRLVRVAAPATKQQPPPSATRLPPPLILPELISEAADTPHDERLVKAAADTMLTLSGGMQDAVRAASVPHQFNVELLKALRPDWGATTADVYERLKRLWFVTDTPEGSCVQAVVRRAMLRHLFRKADLRGEYQRYSLRAARYYYGKLIKQSAAYGKRNARFVSQTFFRLLPPDGGAPTDYVEWLYHLALGDPSSAHKALQQLGDRWLAAGQVTDLHALLEALQEHLEPGEQVGEQRLPDNLQALLYFYRGSLLLQAKRLSEALTDLNRARTLGQSDPALLNRIYQAISEALDVLTPPDRSLTPDSSVWSSLSRPVADRAHWGLWADLQLPQPPDDEVRRIHEMLLVYQEWHNLSGAALAQRLIGDDHRARGDYHQALEWYRSSYGTLREAVRDEGESHSHMLDEAITLKALGDTLYLMGRAHDALRQYDESLQVHARMPGDEVHEADARKAKGDVLHFLGQYHEALPEYDLALAAYRQRGAVMGEGETLLAQGRLLHALNHHDEAQRSYEEALGIYRRTGSSIGVANALLVIGSGAQLRGDSAKAAEHFKEALEIYRKQKNEAGEAAALKALGDAHVKLREFDRALPCYTEALTQFETAGLRRNHAETELALGHLHREEAAYAIARQHYQNASDQFTAIHDQRGAADAQLALGVMQNMQREGDEAQQWISEALVIYRQVRDRYGEAQALRFRGEVYLTLDDYHRALADFEAALSLWREMRDPIGAAKELYGLMGHTLALLNKAPEAARAFELAAEKQSPQEFGWLGWRDMVTKEFTTAKVHFAAVQSRDAARSWRVGLALAQWACGDRVEAAREMDAALRNANPQTLGEACRWIEAVALTTGLAVKAEQFGLMC
ncbi:MAG TPA: tetratricopeptide repeat protein, partial [Anaerolineae bacterium]|nr:tetratricopeptide repeat protein [Anaerolineae bacterium]